MHFVSYGIHDFNNDIIIYYSSIAAYIHPF